LNAKFVDRPVTGVVAMSAEPVPVSAALSCGMPYEYSVPELPGDAPLIEMFALSASLALLLITRSVNPPAVR
jgi:hypothetical protein